MQLAANLTYLFTELPMLDRFAAAKEAGFTGIEILFPYDLSARELTRAIKASGLVMVAMNTPPPNWSGGPRGFAAIVGGEAKFRKDFDRGLRYAEVLNARHIHIMAGRASGPEAKHTMIENLKWAANRAPHASLLIEPVCSKQVPEYFLDSPHLAAEIIAAVGAPNLGMQFDTYHVQSMTGDVLAAWQEHAHLVRHIQVAGFPDRSEPIAGKIDYPRLLENIIASGYSGWITGEYAPMRGTPTGLGWMQDFLRHQPNPQI